jgi:hypothetical protein
MQDDDIMSLAPLGAVSTLRTLVIDGATLVDPEGVARLTSLQTLTATGVFDDAAPLATLINLQRLRIAQTSLADRQSDPRSDPARANLGIGTANFLYLQGNPFRVRTKPPTCRPCKRAVRRSTATANSRFVLRFLVRPEWPGRRSAG